MLNVDVSNMWCSVTLPTLLESEQEIAAAHASVTDIQSMNFLPWLETVEDSPDLARIERTAETIRQTAQVLVVIGNESAVLGVRAVLELCKGWHFNLTDGGPQILFTGEDFSTHSWLELSSLLENRDFCVHIISRDGAAMQSAITIRALRWILERRYGSEKARERVFVTTDPSLGSLRQISQEEGFCTFNLPPMLAGHGSVLAPGCLLPLAVAGVDLRALLEGANVARTAMSIRSFENPAWLYAAGRTILLRKGRRVETLCYAEPDAQSLGRWWRRLFAERTGNAGQGLLPMTAELPGDWFQMEPMLLDTAQPQVLTMLRFAEPEQKVPVEMDWKDADGLNFLEGFTLDYVQEQTVTGAVEAASAAGIPLMSIECESVGPGAVGELLYFFELTSCLCAQLVERDLRQRTAAPASVKNALCLLGKGGV